MTPKEQRNALLAEKLIKNLERRNITASYCDTKEEAVKQVLSMITPGQTVSWGGAMSLHEAGIIEALYAADVYNILDRERTEGLEAKNAVSLKAFDADVFLSSANAMGEDGTIVNIDRNGNRVAAITYGPRKVIFVIGLNKVCRDMQAAIDRARYTAAPINNVRLNTGNPCTHDGACHNCTDEACLCNYIHILRHSYQQRHHVVLVGEDLGY